ncbi:hypothetical protein vBAcePPAc_0136 [Aeromonas phage vB_AceP_PAc]|nr:hypothetical protein vBAcePPAc_0136 [Aeromonas phage vB_AceP_PAc]
MAISLASKFSEKLREDYPIISKNRSKVCCVGINDSDYLTQPKPNGLVVKCPIYDTWKNIINRSYNTKLHKTNPTYKDVEVCTEWLVFSNFREWFIKNHIDGYHLDKDIFSKEVKIYSPETCIYIPVWLNSFITANGASRGKYKIGVHWSKHNKKFVAQISNPISFKNEFIGYFQQEDLAHNAWLKRKLELTLELKPEMDKIDIRIYPNVVNIIHNIK